MENRFNLSLSMKELISLITLACVIAPLVFWAGRYSARIGQIEEYIQIHETESNIFKKTIIEDHRSIGELVESTKKMAQNQERMTEILARITAQVEILNKRVL